MKKRGEQGASRSYALRRLASERPDLHAQCLAGDLTPTPSPPRCTSALASGHRHGALPCHRRRPQTPAGSVNCICARIIRLFGFFLEQAYISILTKRGRPRKQNKCYNNVTILGHRGNSSQYLLARLARDYPHHFVRLQAGEFRSVYAAAKAAGLVRPATRQADTQAMGIPRDPPRPARAAGRAGPGGAGPTRTRRRLCVQWAWELEEIYFD